VSQDHSPVEWALPRWAADLIRQTIEMDARYGAFDPELRRALSAALDGINEGAVIECAVCHQLCAADKAHLHQGRYVCDERCWDDRLKASE
jgi:hypothetical protein